MPVGQGAGCISKVNRFCKINVVLNHVDSELFIVSHSNALMLHMKSFYNQLLVEYLVVEMKCKL